MNKVSFSGPLLYSLSLLPVHHEVRSSSSTHSHYHDVLPKDMGPSTHGLALWIHELKWIFPASSCSLRYSCHSCSKVTNKEGIITLPQSPWLCCQHRGFLSPWTHDLIVINFIHCRQQIWRLMYTVKYISSFERKWTLSLRFVIQMLVTGTLSYLALLDSLEMEILVQRNIYCLSRGQLITDSPTLGCLDSWFFNFTVVQKQNTLNTNWT
jgi:hypothetical protein